VVFEHGHCLLTQQKNPEDYLTMLDEEVQKIAGAVLHVHDTGIPGTGSTTGSSDVGALTLCMENLCGSFRVTTDHVAASGNVGQHGVQLVGTYVEHRQFIGTHYLFHTIHGRLAYRIQQKTWNFKGSRSLEDLVTFVRDLTNDTESPMYPAVSMLSVTLRTNTALVIDPVHSLMRRVIERLYAGVVAIQTRVDDTNNLFFMDIVSWKALLAVVQRDRQGGSDADPSTVQDTDVQYVRGYLSSAASTTSSQPTASIGFTRKGVFFIRVTFPRGCVCAVSGSNGMIHGVRGTVPADVCEGGVEPFVNVVVRFIVLVLVKIRALG
jgi:hypothetical protein